MTPPEIKIHYQNMERFRVWSREKELKARTMHQRLTTQTEALRARAWVSPAADKFYREMEDALAGVKRLSNALVKMDETLALIISKFKEAEEAGKSEIKVIPMDGVIEREGDEGGSENSKPTNTASEQTNAKTSTSSPIPNRMKTSADDILQDDGGVTEPEDDNARYDPATNLLNVNGKSYLVGGSRYSQITDGQHTAILYRPESAEAFAQSLQAARDAAIDPIVLSAITKLRESAFGPALAAAVGLNTVGARSVNVAGGTISALETARAAVAAGQAVTVGNIAISGLRGFATSVIAQTGANIIEITTGASLFGDDQDVIEETTVRIAPWVEQQIQNDYADEIQGINEVNGVLGRVEDLVGSSTSLIDPSMNVILYQEEGQIYLYVEVVDMSNASESVTIPVSQDAALILDQALAGGA